MALQVMRKKDGGDQKVRKAQFLQRHKNVSCIKTHYMCICFTIFVAPIVLYVHAYADMWTSAERFQAKYENTASWTVVLVGNMTNKGSD